MRKSTLLPRVWPFAELYRCVLPNSFPRRFFRAPTICGHTCLKHKTFGHTKAGTVKASGAIVRCISACGGRTWHPDATTQALAIGRTNQSFWALQEVGQVLNLSKDYSDHVQFTLKHHI